jgi:hypothetical protein
MVPEGQREHPVQDGLQREHRQRHQEYPDINRPVRHLLLETHDRPGKPDNRLFYFHENFFRETDRNFVRPDHRPDGGFKKPDGNFIGRFYGPDGQFTCPCNGPERCSVNPDDVMDDFHGYLFSRRRC